MEPLEPRLVLTGPAVIETSPGAYALSVPLETDVAVLFDQAVAALSVTPNAIVAYAEFSGRLPIEPADITVDGDSATIELPRRLYPGERITVTVTPNVENGVGESATPHQWEFRAQAVGGTADFEFDLPRWDVPNGAGIAVGDLDSDGMLDVVAGASGEVWLNRGLSSFERRSLGAPLPSPVSKVADLDGDGDLDLMMFGGEQRQLWLNNGNASFVSGATESWPAAIRWGEFHDFNGDGALDAIFPVANGGPVLAFNDGAGNLSVSQIVGTTYQGGNLTVADLDEDGDLDFVGNFLQGSQFEVWSNNGDATFTFKREIDGLDSSVAADVDADGDEDLLVGYFLFRNLGHGELAAPIAIAEHNGSGGRVVSTQDFDGDGDLDALFAEYGELRVLLNDGDGNFVETGRKFPGHEAQLPTGDFDGDGDLDVVLPGASSSVGFLLNKSNLTGIYSEFDGPVDGEVGDEATYVLQVENRGAQTLTGARVDFTPPPQLQGVTWTAVASAGSATAPSGNGAIHVPAQLLPGGVIQYTITGALDAFPDSHVTLNATATPANNALPGFDSVNLRVSTQWTTSIVVFPTDGSGYFQPSDVRLRDQLSQQNTGDVQFGDLDGDGDEDAVVSPPRAPGELWFNDGTGQFTRVAQAIGANTGGKVFLRDVSGDGDLDIYMPQFGGIGSLTRLWVNNGQGKFTRNDVTIPFAPEEIIDINGDGRLDALYSDPYGAGFRWMMGLSSVQFEGSGQVLPREAKLAGDLDGDGDLDMLLTRESVYRNVDGTSVLFNNGQGFFASDESRFLVSSFTGSQVGDVDGDGDLDLLFASARCYSCNPAEFAADDQLWLNDGAGNFTRDERQLPARRSADFTLVDLDGDRDLDVFRQSDQQSRRFEVWLNDGTGAFVSAGQSAAEFAGALRRFADVDADGDLDALFVGTNQIWLNQIEYARVSVTNANNVSSVAIGDEITYTVVVANDGNIASTNLRVEQTLPDWLTDVTWNAIATAGTTATLSGSGPITEVIDLPVGASVVYTIKATVGVPTDSPFPQRVDTNVTLVPDANVFHPDVSALSAGQSDPLTLPFTGGGYLANAAADYVGGRIVSAALGDLDGDGDLDLAGAYNGVQVWINEGDGKFPEHRDQYFGSTFFNSLSLVDLDADGDLDILPSRGDTINGSAALLENDGQGRFTTSFQDLGPASDIAAGDFDGDGNLDLMYARIKGGVEIDFQNSTGQFTKGDWPLDYAYARYITPGDWDADGDLDVIVVHGGVPVILANNGEGRFAEVARIGADDATFDVLASDLNADGHLDLYLAKQGGDEVWLNNGAGTFIKTAQALGTANNASAAIGDLDGDGDLDVFALNDVWFNDGTGHFVAAEFHMIKPGAGYATIGDIDGDGDADVLSDIFIWRNFADANDLAVTVTNNAEQLVFGDVATYTLTVTNRGDYMLQGIPVTSAPLGMLIGATWTSTGSPGVVSTPSGTGAILDQVALPTGGSVTYTLTGRVGGVIGQMLSIGLRTALPEGATFYDQIENNHSIDADPIVASPNFGGRGRFVDSGQRFGAATNNVQAADLDGDGDIDFLETSLTAPGRVWMNDGIGNFTDSGQALGDGSVRDAVLADLDGDLDLDIFLLIADASDRVWLNDGNGVFAISDGLIGDAQSTGIAAAAGDFNGDGLIDILVAESGDVLSRVWYGAALERFSASAPVSNSQRLSDAAFIDADNDGDLDLLLASLEPFGLSLLVNNGAGEIELTRGYGNAKPTSSLAVGDFDGDGWQDIAASGPAGVALLYNRAGIHENRQFMQVSGIRSVALGDVNGDGRADLFLGRGADSGPLANVMFYYRRDSAYFDLENPHHLGSSYTNAMAVADFDSDGDLDVAFGNRGDAERDATSLWLNAIQLGDTAPYDGRVDINDLNTVRNYFGAAGPDGALGDADGDGDVDVADLNAVRNHFGASANSPSTQVTLATPVPPARHTTLEELASRHRIARSRPVTSLLELEIWQRVFEEIGRTRPRRTQQ